MGMQRGLVNLLKAQWFLVGLFCVVTAAKCFPDVGKQGGQLHPEITVKYGAVPIIFMFSGMTLNSDDIVKAITSLRTHAFVQSFHFALTPAFFTIVGVIVRSMGLIMPSLVQGIVAVGCMPPPVSSAAILTRSAGGNDAVALVNSCLGSILGVTVTPMLLILVVGRAPPSPSSAVLGADGSNHNKYTIDGNATLVMAEHGSAFGGDTDVFPLSEEELSAKAFDNRMGGKTSAVIVDLVFTVIVPILFGQVIHLFCKDQFKINKWPLSTIGSCLLLYIIFCTFCETFLTDAPLTVGDVVVTEVIVILLQLALFMISYALCTSPAFVMRVKSWTDIIPILFSTTHKSLTLGVPLLKIIFETHPSLSVLTVPICCWHATQLILGSILVPRLKQKVMAQALPR